MKAHMQRKTKRVSQYVKEIEDFRYKGQYNPHWKGVKTDFNFKNNYVFFTVDDIVEHVIVKYNLLSEKRMLVLTHTALKSIVSQTFVKQQITPHNTAYAYVANKKRLDRFIRQNINRFLRSIYGGSK